MVSTASRRWDGLHLVPTSACNMRCAYCYQDRHLRQRIGWPTIERALDTVLEGPSTEVRIGFYGGEPLLAFGLVRQTIEEAERRAAPERPLRFQLTTNGLLFDEAKATFLATHEVEAQISFDGSRTAQDLRGPGTHGRVLRRIRTLRENLPEYFVRHVKIAVTVPPEAVPALARSVGELIRCDVATIDVAPGLGAGHLEWTARDERDLERQMHRVYQDSLRLFERTRRVPVTLFRRRPGRVAPPANGQMCGLARGGRLTVDVDGEVYGCTALARSYQTLAAPGLAHWVAPLRIGPLEEPDLEGRVEAFRSAVARSPLFGDREKKHTSHGSCRECRFRGECLICPTAVARAGEDPHRIPDFLCAFNRVSLSYRERFPPQLISSPRPSAS